MILTYYLPTNVNDRCLVKGSLHPTDIISLFTNPLMIIPAPGIGKYILCENMIARLNFNSVAYSGNQNLNVIPSVNPLINAAQIGLSGIISSSFTKWHRGAGSSSSSALTSSIVENAPMYLSTQSVNPSGGDSTIDFNLWYYIINV
jgi:hypothetical protein